MEIRQLVGRFSALQAPLIDRAWCGLSSMRRVAAMESLAKVRQGHSARAVCSTGARGKSQRQLKGASADRLMKEVSRKYA